MNLFAREDISQPAGVVSFVGHDRGYALGPSPEQPLDDGDVVCVAGGQDRSLGPPGSRGRSRTCEMNFARSAASAAAHSLLGISFSRRGPVCVHSNAGAIDAQPLLAGERSRLESVENPPKCLPASALRPAREAPICALPPTQRGRKVAPRRASSQDPANGIEELAVTLAERALGAV